RSFDTTNDRAHPDGPLSNSLGQGIDELPHSGCERAERRAWGALATFRLSLGASGSQKACSSSAQREPIGKSGAKAQAKSVACVDPAEQRLEDDVEHLAAEATLEKFAERDVTSIGVDMRLGALAKDAHLSAHRQEGRAQEGAESCRNAEHQPLRPGHELAPTHDVD